MADDQESADDERAIELSTISYIFPELQINPSNPFAASLEIPVSPAKPLPVIFAAQAAPPTPPPSDGTADDGFLDAADAGPQICLLSHLHPLKLQISLPEGYPSSVGPEVSVFFDQPYLSEQKIGELKSRAQKRWEENGRSEVLYDYIDFLQQAAEDAFGLVSAGGAPLELPQDLSLPLMDFDLRAKRAAFEKETFDCGVCLEPKKGTACHRLVLCGHVFCRSCLRDFYDNCITEGDVFGVKCLDPDCEKKSGAVKDKRRGRKKRKDRTLSPSELLEIPLEQEQVQRYVSIKRKKELEANKNTVYCPRKWCQAPARTSRSSADGGLDDEDDDEDDGDGDEEKDEATAKKPTTNLPPPSERLAICTSCGLAFCSVCRQGWHGEIVFCLPPRSARELTAEERATELYLELHSTPCPTCGARCQKTQGCNHMHCTLCDSHYCYLCSAWLDPGNPYTHFNTTGLSCYQRLWELEEGDGGDVEQDAAAPAAEEGGNGDHEAQARAPVPAPVQIPPPPPPPPPQAPAPQAPAQAPARQQQQQQRDQPIGPWEVPRGIRVNRRARQGLVRREAVPDNNNNNDNNNNPEAFQIHGLQRFLAMVEDDREDEWDSDELDEGDFVIPTRGQ